MQKGKMRDHKFRTPTKIHFIPIFKKYGKTQRAITYTPDFLIYHLDGSQELIDVKGYSTQQGELRKKLFDYLNPGLKLTWVAKSLKYGESGWIEYNELQKIRRGNRKTGR
jgi:hypothetical protein